MKNVSPLSNLLIQPLLLGGLITSLMLVNTAAIAQSQTTRQKLTAPEANRETKLDGPIAGGGGFICTTSERVLDNAKSQLANQIRMAPHIVFTTLPSGWTKERIVNIVETVRLEDEKPAIRRHGKKLRFNYGQDDKGEYIEALEPFCYTYEGTEIDSGDKATLDRKYRQVQIEILHEIAHLMNIGQTKETDVQAREFAQDFVSKLTNTFVYCEFPRLTAEQKQNALPDVPVAMLDSRIIFAPIANKILTFYDTNGMPDRLSLESISKYKSDIVVNALYSYLSFKLKNNETHNIAAKSTVSWVQQFARAGIRTVEVFGDMKEDRIYSAMIILENFEKYSMETSSGECMVIAQPLKMAGGVK